MKLLKRTAGLLATALWLANPVLRAKCREKPGE